MSEQIDRWIEVRTDEQTDKKWMDR
jgi:hypothetical protein